MGLSPLARGTQARASENSAIVRFIPAGAGNTSSVGSPRLRQPVYPRWRGEHLQLEQKRKSQLGLSPLARGTCSGAGKSVLCLRFIPAGAGNTSRSEGIKSSSPVYPRWRGEHSDNQHHARAQCGLSPLARGTQCVQILPALEKRFIPAGAGNTLPESFALRYSPVYPRWRGEHRINDTSDVPNCGLSPLARGTPHKRYLGRPELRFIPAGAGNTIPSAHAPAPPPVYPRWRGEHLTSRARTGSPPGLSPLARGTPYQPQLSSLR